MYKIGDYVICRSGGVWLIEELSQNSCRLRRYDNNDVQSADPESDEIVRCISSKADIEEVIDRVGFIRTVQAPNDRLRLSFLEESMAEFDDVEWVKVIKTVYLRAQERPVSEKEQTLANRAKNFFYSEVSIVLDMPLPEVEGYISGCVEQDNW